MFCIVYQPCFNSIQEILPHRFLGILTFYDTVSKKSSDDKEKPLLVPGFERKDVWDMKWADDNAELFTMMERTFMYIFRSVRLDSFDVGCRRVLSKPPTKIILNHIPSVTEIANLLNRGTDPEETINTSGYICSFTDLQIASVNLDDVMRVSSITDFQCGNDAKPYKLERRTSNRRLFQEIRNQIPPRHSRTLGQGAVTLSLGSWQCCTVLYYTIYTRSQSSHSRRHQVDITDTYNFVEQNSHPRLWRLLAEAVCLFIINRTERTRL